MSEFRKKENDAGRSVSKAGFRRYPVKASLVALRTALHTPLCSVDKWVSNKKSTITGFMFITRDHAFIVECVSWCPMLVRWCCLKFDKTMARYWSCRLSFHRLQLLACFDWSLFWLLPLPLPLAITVDLSHYACSHSLASPRCFVHLRICICIAFVFYFLDLRISKSFAKSYISKSYI